MTRRAWTWVAGLLVADAVLWILTLTAQANFQAAPGGAVTSLPIVFGWIASIALLVGTGLVVLGARQAQAYRQPGPSPSQKKTDKR